MKQTINAHCSNCGRPFSYIVNDYDFVCDTTINLCADCIKPKSTNYIQSELESIYKDLKETLQRKNSDYSGTDNEFGNFEVSARVARITVEQGIINRLMDKMSRLSNLLSKESAVKEETFYDTITDAIGYLTILSAYRRKRMGSMANKEMEKG